ncbi:unnamed protein product [Zymoseptoria tritici ST99CH_1A5]|uniref:Uncharacterized protein n=2 Tax=Zymoseptoria tritici TaxID=1047171 RepID=A0A2H1FY25_ZYMTR|nr:unnamed protein product [Zymoseptoria tritici ST99CH_1E4]SMR47467.1 unnamed protein product [Zymoseptoria tritici ST99CH_3D1]SMY21366.1 unnamed protein product [Zymoseptoria tritici ST99CH_1A5]
MSGTQALTTVLSMRTRKPAYVGVHDLYTESWHRAAVVKAGLMGVTYIVKLIVEGSAGERSHWTIFNWTNLPGRVLSATPFPRLHLELSTLLYGAEFA